MYKSCTKCGGIHKVGFKCNAGVIYRTHSTEDAKARNKTEYKKASLEVKEASNYLCAVCLESGVYNSTKIETHHIEKIKDRPDLLCDIDNLICLCKFHHLLADKNILSKEHLRRLRKVEQVSPGG